MHTSGRAYLFQGLIGDLGWHFPTAWQETARMFVDGTCLTPCANLSSGKLASVGFVLTSWKSFPTSDDCWTFGELYSQQARAAILKDIDINMFVHLYYI